MDDLEMEISTVEGSSENDFLHKIGSSKDLLSDGSFFASPRTPEALVMMTPTKPDVDSNYKVQEKLETTLEKHGIDRENASDFFQGLVKDKDFKNLFMASVNKIGDESCNDSNDGVDAGPMTRSKLKNFIQNSPHKVHWVNRVTASKSNLPKFSDIPLPDNDDEDDEYQPVDVPAEESFESDPSHHASGPTKETMPPEALDDGNTSPPRLLIDIQDDLVPNPQSVRSDVISKRTRSKHSLESMSLDVLEAAFNPPDVTDDFQDCNMQSLDDYDWLKWLLDLTKADLNASNNEDDNIDEDPDFNGLAELERSENDEINDSAALEVPIDELLGLLEEFENPQTLRSLTGPAASSTPIVKQPLSTRNAPSKRKFVRPKRKAASSQTSEHVVLELKPSQMELIEQQMQQHVQLLLQANLLSRNTIYDGVIQQTGEMIHELYDMSVSQMTILGLQRSYLSPCNLEEALKLISNHIPPSDPVMRLHKIEKLKRHVPIPSLVAENLGNTEACMYPELLPVSAPLDRPSSQKMPSFLYAEDCLLAHGLSEMKDFPKHKFELISDILLPVRTAKQLSVRYRNVVYCRNAKDMKNPLTRYHNENNLPAPNTMVKHVLPCDARKPVNMVGNVPCWIHALKPTYETRQTSIKVGYSNMLSSNSVMHASSKSKSSIDEVPSTVTSAAGVVACIVSCSSTSASEPITLQTNQLSMFQTYRSVNDQDSVYKMKENESGAAPAGTGGNANQSIHGSNTLTYQSLGVVTTSKVQPSIKYGRRKSAGKSIKRMRKELLSSSSSSESEDDSQRGPKSSKTDNVKERVQISAEDSGGEDKDNLQVEESRVLHRPSPNLTTWSKTAASNEPKQVPPAGGYVQKLHPKLLGKKSKMSTKDASKIKSSAQMIKTLEDDANVLSDPHHAEKEKIFATGYLARVKNALQPQPGKHEQFLNTLKRFTDDNSSPVDIFKDITELLHNWPDLVQGFVPFLTPSQAKECGLAYEKGVYERANRFLRQLELQFADNRDQLDLILEILDSFSKTAIYREEDVLNSILTLLKGYPYLQDEFVTFFDSQPPPKILFGEDFEEVDLTDDTIKDPNAGQFEHVTLNAGTRETDPIIIETVPSTKKSKKRSISQCSLDEPNVATSLPNAKENKENIYPGAEPLEDTVNYDSESEDVLTEDEANHSASIAIAPPNMGIINEDALSSSPFKRITGEVELLRPRTPTGIAETTSDTIIFSAGTSSLAPCMSSNSNFPILPATPGKLPTTAKKHGQESHYKPREPDHSLVHTKDSFTCTDIETELSQRGSASVATHPLLSDTNENASASAAVLTLNKPSIQVDDEGESSVSQCSTVKNQPTQETVSEQSPKKPDKQSPDRPKEDEVTTTEKWTRTEDEVLLTTCQQGISEKMFSEIAKKLGRSVQEVERRLSVLCDISDESEEDVYSDSSAS